MSHTPRGAAVPLSVGRKLVAEFLRQARHVPLVSIRREFAVGDVASLRELATPRVSWVALFAKAYALAAVRHNRLRRSWTTFPFPRLYEHPVSAAVVLVEREWAGEEVVLGGKVHEPEIMPLAAIDGAIRRFATAPVRSVSSFRQLLRIGGYPRLLLRLLFWWTLQCSGFRRSKRYGTFVISSLGNFGCEAVCPRVPLTGYLTFGPIADDGQVTVSLTFDHRVMDGRHAARALEDMERLLTTVVANELRQLTSGSASRPTHRSRPVEPVHRLPR